MNNFIFYSPTEFAFGKDTEELTGKLVKKYKGTKVLVHFGGGSVKKSGLLNKAEDSLKAEKIDYILLGGAKPNPINALVYEGITLCREEKIDFILAVGGGSAIDSAKAIAAGVLYHGDFWDFFERKAEIKEALPVGAVLTIPAAGSEGSSNTVITQELSKRKLGTGAPALRPVFSILNPIYTYSLPPFQTACGIADMMAHILERYFTQTTGVEISDRLCEGILLTIINQGPIVFKEPENYNARSNIMWAGTVAHNGTCGVGRVEDWASHGLEHELSALYDVAHGAGLAVIFPAWMKYVYQENVSLFAQYANRVWGVEVSEDKEAMALKGIDATKEFFASIGLPTNFIQLGAKKSDIDKLISNLAVNCGGSIGSFKKLSMEDAKAIYEIACQ
ncbi:butanol dehydrogenase [endosymbiont 'TC1' of Trimyema compressum]|uniref:iron-containing alcohol dehydrogenase n=1 Tax=endosymbiont 'TC1' of Trimyema compressum TaxID=243899 RepID=UPI0007F09044|nr:iron-containing alcohol dehydrogenase [endosymbiont 'TC1' of Trimyema compressum]AMP21243.1 butanol dehydrogenase [endosymbiont 'TC1' of Trimyema compressum]